MPGREPAPPTESPDHPRPGAFTTSPPGPNVATEQCALAERLRALAERLEADPAAAQEQLAREAYRLRRLTQEVVAGLAGRSIYIIIKQLLKINWNSQGTKAPGYFFNLIMVIFML